jgi:hypothetical protein
MEQRYKVEDEAAFLQQQAADAKVAMQRTLAEMQETAKSAADIGAWTRKYPWYAVGAAAAAGFITATTVLSPPQRQRHGAHTETTSASGSSLLSSALSLLWRMGRGVLMSALVSAIGVTISEAESDDDESAFEHAPVAK